MAFFDGQDDMDDTIHLSKPGIDTGHFTTLEVRPRSAATRAQLTSRTIAFPKGNYTQPPNIAAGFSMLDLAIDDTIDDDSDSQRHSFQRNASESSLSASSSHGSEYSLSSSSNASANSGAIPTTASAVRANLIGSHITNKSFHIGLETWDGSLMRAASATWIEHAAGAKECHFGQIDTLDHTSGQQRQPIKPTGRPHTRTKRAIKFPEPFADPPAVICWINRLDLASGPRLRYRLAATASNITRSGATVRIGDLPSSSSDGKGSVRRRDAAVLGAGMCWIAFPAGKRLVDCGRIVTEAGNRVSQAPRRHAGRVTFRQGWLDVHSSSSSGASNTQKQKQQIAPTVLCALDMLDMDGGRDLCIGIDVSEIDATGFTWRIETWGNSRLYAASASWIALGAS